MLRGHVGRWQTRGVAVGATEHLAWDLVGLARVGVGVGVARVLPRPGLCPRHEDDGQLIESLRRMNGEDGLSSS